MSRLRNLQIEWNQLVPAAQAAGLRGVREVALYPQGLHERIPHRQNRLEWLRRELNMSAAITSVGTDLTFGVELECILPRGMSHVTIAAAITAAGVECHAEMYNHSLRHGWKVVTDGSLGDYVHGAEIVSPVLSGDSGFEQLRKVCTALTTAGVKVNKRCGLHVHIGARNEQLSFFKNLINLYVAAEPAIDSFLAPSRRGPQGGNGFCKSIRVNAARLNDAANLDQVAQAIGQTPGTHEARSRGRYCKLNLQSFWQHGTVEFRHHQGTVEANKAENWVRLCLRMALAARKGNTPATTLEGLLATIGATESESRYFTGRAAYFTSRQTRRAA